MPIGHIMRTRQIPAYSKQRESEIYLQDGFDLEGFPEEFPSVSRADGEEFLLWPALKSRVTISQLSVPGSTRRSRCSGRRCRRRYRERCRW